MNSSGMALEVHLAFQDHSRTTHVVKAGNPVALQELVEPAPARMPLKRELAFEALVSSK